MQFILKNKCANMFLGIWVYVYKIYFMLPHSQLSELKIQVKIQILSNLFYIHLNLYEFALAYVRTNLNKYVWKKVAFRYLWNFLKNDFLTKFYQRRWSLSFTFENSPGAFWLKNLKDVNLKCRLIFLKNVCKSFSMKLQQQRPDIKM